MEELGDQYPLSDESPVLNVTEKEVVFGDLVVPRQSGAEGEVNLFLLLCYIKLITVIQN